MIHAPITPPVNLSRRQRVLIEYFRRIGNVFVPAALLIGIATLAWMVTRVAVSVGNRVSAATEARMRP